VAVQLDGNKGIKNMDKFKIAIVGIFIVLACYSIYLYGNERYKNGYNEGIKTVVDGINKQKAKDEVKIKGLEDKYKFFITPPQQIGVKK
jgi:hypothetical protein